ncbi:MAG: hypothetical protein ACQERB_15565 [Promethearchaeati archaeon]
MSDSEWIKVKFKQFVNNFGIKIITDNAPEILFSKEDKEHESYNSLIGFFLILGGLLIYISISVMISSIYFSIPLFASVIVICVIIASILIFNYWRTNVRIKPIECWIEIFKGPSEGRTSNYCFTFYPIFSGKCHPNEAKNLIYKLYEEEIYGNTIDITQIELYLTIEENDPKKVNQLGFFFQYGEGKPFAVEDLKVAPWQFFHYEKKGGDNYIAVANWFHQYEWRFDLALDYDKLNSYAPWIIQKWDPNSIKPLTQDYKFQINWEKRLLNSLPKLKPWEGSLSEQKYYDPNLYKDLKIIEDAIAQIVGENTKVENYKDIKEKLFEFKAYFQDLKS